ncbi:MAG: VRR-NUC domain-containing protein, partial [Chromatocurvus sp.]
AELAGLSLPNKPALLAAVADLGETETRRAQRLCDGLGERLIRVSGGDTLALLQLLFFGNSRQSLVDFVLSDLGVATYWPYPLSKAQRVFETRDAVEAYRQADDLSERHAQWQESREADALAALAADALALDSDAEAVARRVHRLCNRIARDCERESLPEVALNLYTRSELHPARERALRVLEAQGAEQEALTLATRVLASPWCEGEKATVTTIRQRLLRRVHGTRIARPRDRFPTRMMTLTRGVDSVERAAARALEAEGWLQARHVENALFNGLFGLAFWDQLFAAVPGAFHHPFQAGPADMFSSRFEVRRRPALERRLRQLAACDLEAELLRVHERCAGYQCRWVDWRVITPALVRGAVRCIPFRHLVAAWRRLLFDPQENRRGQPDLVVLGEHAGQYALWEVKGPGDALQPHQRRWLNYLCELGAPAGVLKVVWEDA